MCSFSAASCCWRKRKEGGDAAPQNLIPLMDKANQGPVKKQPWEREKVRVAS